MWKNHINLWLKKIRANMPHGFACAPHCDKLRVMVCLRQEMEPIQACGSER